METIEKKLNDIEKAIYRIIPSQVMNMKEAAKYLGISKKNLRKLLDEREITHIVAGGNIYIERYAIYNWFQLSQKILSNFDEDMRRD